MGSARALACSVARLRATQEAFRRRTIWCVAERSPLTGYRVVVSNFGGAVTSVVATLSVTSLPPTPGGAFEWVRDAAGPEYDQGLGIAADGLNLISGTIYDAFLAKYTSAGNLVWLRQGRGDGYEGGRAVAVEANGIFSSAFLMKCDSGGNPLWVRVSNGGNRYCYGIGIDGSANVYLTGGWQQNLTLGTVTLAGTGQFANVFVAKGDSSGNFLWAKAAGKIGGAFSSSIGVDAVGNSYVAGYFLGTNTFGTTNLATEELAPAIVQGDGTVSKSPDEPTYNVGDSVTLIATAGRWHIFSHWGDGASVNPRVIPLAGTTITSPSSRRRHRLKS
jgi:hypothetical protein